MGFHPALRQPEQMVTGVEEKHRGSYNRPHPPHRPSTQGDKCELGRCKSLWKPRLVLDSETVPVDLPTDPLAERQEGSPRQ